MPIFKLFKQLFIPHKHSFQNGQALILALIFLTILLILGNALLSTVTHNYSLTYKSYHRSQTLSIAEAGLDYGVRQLNINSSYSGTTLPVSFSPGEFEVAVAGSGSAREVISTGYFPSKTSYQIKRTLKANITSNSTNVSYSYGVQAGEGGITMKNNSRIIGHVYSNGSINGSNGAAVTGTAIVAGGTGTNPDLSFTSNNSTYDFGKSEDNADIAQSFVAPETSTINKISLYIKRIGSPSNITVRVVTDNNGEPSQDIIASGALNTLLVWRNNYSWVNVYFTSSQTLNQGDTYWFILDANPNPTHYWSVKFDSPGGFADGTGMFSNNWNQSPTASWSLVNGDFPFKIYMGKAITYIDNLRVGEDAYTRLFNNGNIGRDYHGKIFNLGSISRNAYAQSVTLCTIGGNAYADINLCITHGSRNPGQGEADRQPAPYSVLQGNIDSWKEDASVNVINGDYNPVGSTVSLGPAKVVGNINMENNQTLVLTGLVYVTGTINFANNDIIRLDPGFGSNSTVMIADGPVNINNNVQFFGSGQPNTYIMVVSTNNSVDPANPAINIINNADGAIFFAPSGMLKLNNNIHIKEATGYQLYLEPRSVVEYDEGLQDVSFTPAPSANWTLNRGSWREIAS